MKGAVKHTLWVSVAIAFMASGCWAGTVHGAAGDPDEVWIVKADGVMAQTMTRSKGEFSEVRRVLSKNEHLRVRILSDAGKYLGTPYVFGARYGQTDAFDCSSFVKTVFAQNGIEVPRVSRSQALEGTYISRKNLQAGDLVFFATEKSASGIGHVGIYAGGGMMIHTYGDGGVKYSTIERGWWADRYVTARRLIQE